MVDWTDIPDRNRGQKRPRYSANVAPIRPGQDDARSAYLRNSFIDSVNDTRKKRATRAATVDNPQWAMSRDADWYQNRDNLSSIKDTLVNQQGNRDFLTTDQDESRNMYQMLMNQMKGGDQGARMLNTQGLPAGARRIGRTLFQDPSKSAGFLNDLKVMLGDVSFQDQRLPEEKRTSNPAAVQATEYNPFPKAGFGEQFYKDEFPIASSFGNLMGLAEKSPTLSMLASLFPKKEKIPLDRHSDFFPENNVPSIEFDEIANQPFMGEFEEEIDLSPGTDWYGPYNEDWEKLQAYHRGDLERNEDIERIFFDETIDDGSQEIEIKEDEFNIELSPDRKQELRDLLLSPEFQARPYHEKKEILEGFGWTEPDLLSGLQ